MTEHGTRPRYVRGCRCQLCRAANASYAASRHEVMTGLTRHSPAWRQPWTPAEDRELLDGPGTVLARAVRLGRTYMAAVTRLRVLRERQGPA